MSLLAQGFSLPQKRPKLEGKDPFWVQGLFEAGSGHVLLLVVQAEGRLPVGVLQLGHGLQVEQRVGSNTMADFWDFLSKKYFRQISILDTNG